MKKFVQELLVPLLQTPNQNSQLLQPLTRTMQKDLKKKEASTRSKNLLKK